MKRMLGLVLALAVMAGMSMPGLGQEKGKAEAKKGAPAAEKKAGKEGGTKKSETAKKDTKKADKTEKKAAAAKKGEKKADKK